MGRSDFAPLHEHSRFPVSVLDDSCATEGAAHDPIGYEEGLGPEDDPWLVAATLIGAIAGMLLSVMFPNGFQALVP
jgi:hypothetical protein